MASGDTKTESYLRAAAEGTREDLPTDNCCNTKTQNLILGVANRIMDVEDEVEELKNNPDVVDIVDTYADLQSYDTQHLTENDIIRVLQDETHSGNSTYYRFTKNPDTWTFIGEISGGGGSGGTFTPLTTSDYDWNYNTGTAENPNSIGMFLLEDGVYIIQQASPDEIIYICDNPFGGAFGAQDDYFMVQTQSISGGGPQGAYKIKTITDIRNGTIQQYQFYYNWNFQNGWEFSSNMSYVTGDNLESRLNSLTIMPITQTDYDNLGYVDPNTLYIITGA